MQKNIFHPFIQKLLLAEDLIPCRHSYPPEGAPDTSYAFFHVYISQMITISNKICCF